MTDNVHQFPMRKKPQEEALQFLNDLQPEGMLVIAYRDHQTHLITTFEDEYLANYLVDQLKMNLLLGEMVDE